MLPTIEWKDDLVVMIDQRKLPASEVYVTCKTANDVAKAIKTMVIRGAPAIGVAAAMGIAVGMIRSRATGTKQFTTEFQKTCDLMAGTRPTAVNLFWAIERMKKAFAAAAQDGQSVDEIKRCLVTEARAIHDEDVQSCKTMGAYGAGLVPESARILTHCNAGALATAGYGTALGVIRAAAEQGKTIAVLADETRPFLQGARLTAWELVRDGHHRQHGRGDDASGPGRSRRRRRRSHCGQRRCREQDRHLQRGRAGPRARDPVLCRRTAVHG
jgi:methylthioribose-1-phosphate isomerase